MKCQQCGAEYEGHHNSKYCSDQCKETAYKKYHTEYMRRYKPSMGPRHCKWCGKLFESQSGKAQKYCTADCRRESIKQQNRDQVRKPVEKVVEMVACKCCGKMIARTNKRQVYCSATCRNKGSEYERKQENKRPFVSNLTETEEEARRLGMSYGQYKSIEVIEAYARIELPEWARR